MAIFRRKKEQDIDPHKEHANQQARSIFALVVIGIMAFVVIGLRISGVTGDTGDTDEYTLDELFELYGYSDEDIQQRLRPYLEVEAVQTQREPIGSRDGQLRDVYISKPEGEEPFAAVILMHGSPAGERVTVRFSEELGERIAEDVGVLTVAVDWRDSDFGEGDLIDAVSVLDAVEKYTINAVTGEQLPILYVGFEHGAYLSLLAAAEDSERIHGVAAISGYWNLNEQYQFLLENKADSAANFLRETGCDIAVDTQQCLQQRSVTTQALEGIDNLLLMHHAENPLVGVDQATTAQTIRETVNITDSTTVVLLEADNEAVESEIVNAEHYIVDPANTAEFERSYAALQSWLEKQIENFSVAVEDEATELVEEDLTDPLTIELP